MAAGPNGLEEWVGSAYLFVESSLDKVVLSESYAHQQHKAAVYRALRTALAAFLAKDPQYLPFGFSFPISGQRPQEVKAGWGDMAPASGQGEKGSCTLGG